MIKDNNFDKAFLGNDIYFRNCEGDLVKRIYLDSAASCLALKPSFDITQKYLKYYSNTHSTVHLTARISNDVFSWSSNKIKNFVGGDESYATIFMGSGTTAVINRLAIGLSKMRPEKQTVITSSMEHHSNDLPHRKYHQKVIHLPVVNNKTGRFEGIDLELLEEHLKNEKGQVNYIAVTGASNVTGNITPIYEIAKLAHLYDAYIIVDAAQLIAHYPIHINSKKEIGASIDFLAFSGHKIYTPGSPGVLIAKKDLIDEMEPLNYGGGMVNHVSINDFEIKNQADERENAGTPNIPGVLAIATTMSFLETIGMDNVYNKEKRLLSYLIEKMNEIDDLKVYVDDQTDRVGVVSFNMKDIPHELLAKILNDFFGVAVRNDCFCAHPIVREYLLNELWDIEDDRNVESYKGMVRASLGLYSTLEDIDNFIKALLKIASNKKYYMSSYELINDVYINLKCVVPEKFDFKREMQNSFYPFIRN